MQDRHVVISNQTLVKFYRVACKKKLQNSAHGSSGYVMWNTSALTWANSLRQGDPCSWLRGPIPRLQDRGTSSWSHLAPVRFGFLHCEHEQTYISTYISTMYFSKHFKRSEWCFKTHLKNPYSVCVSSVAGWSSTRVFSSRQRRRVLISWICNALEKRIFGSLVGLTLRWKLSPGRLCVGQEYPRKNHKESETRE